MDAIFIGSEAQLLRYSSGEERDGTLEIITSPFLDEDLEYLEEIDFDVIIADFEEVKGREEVIHTIKKSKDSSPLILTTGDITVKNDQSFRSNEMFKEILMTAEKIIEKDESSREDREEMLKSILRHDLMNKIRLMKGTIQILKCDHDLPEDVEQRLQAMEKRIDNCVELVKSVSAHLDTVKEEARAIDPISSLDDVLASFEDVLEEEGFEVSVEIQDSCSVMGGRLLKEIYSNIIENILKHSCGERINISSERVEDGLLISIEDDGVGVPKDLRGKIFEKGFTTKEEGCTGLGLYLVKEIMDIYSGEVKLGESDSGGARFELYFERV